MAAATPSCVCPGCDADAIRRIAIRAQWRSSESSAASGRSGSRRHDEPNALQTIRWQSLDDDTRSRASRTTGHRAISIRKQTESRRSVRTKQQPAWESALAQFKSLSVKACCRQPSSCPRHPGKFRSRLSKATVKIGLREIVGRRPRKYRIHQDDKTLRLPGF
jgi:hypothetical protein